MNRSLTLLVLLLTTLALSGQERKETASAYRLDPLPSVEPVNTQVKSVMYRGRKAVQLIPITGHEDSDEGMMAILAGPDFHNGTIEVEVAGAPKAGAKPNMRGFIGISFRVQDHGGKSETFYLRPSNGRADDQLQRNHSLQYVSDPDFGWKRLRAESPGLYESYADLEAGVWTKMKIVVSGNKAQLYVNGAAQPALIVNDLKQGDTHGQIGLWSHTSTDGYFSELVVTRAAGQ